MNSDSWNTAVQALQQARRVVIFSGAGISAGSGIPTFRDADGFWQRFPPEQFACWSGLMRTALTSPRLLAEFVLHVVEPIAHAAPNAAHRAAARIQDRCPTQVITQNIDGLHQAAGSTIVHEVHGSIWQVMDVSSGRVVHQLQREELLGLAAALRQYVEGSISLLRLGLLLRRSYPWDWLGRHRPRLVLFGDGLAEPDWSQACQAVDRCDLLISVGTSGEVYPAATLPRRAERVGSTVVAIDPQPCQGCWLQGKAEELLPKLVHAAWGDAPPTPPAD